MNRTRLLFPLALILSAFLFSSCHRSQLQPSTTKRYAFTGRVLSINAQNASAEINGDDVPGFMMPMAMTYKIKPPEALKQLAPGDAISAEVVVIQPKNKDDEPSDYWLENVKVTGHAKTPAPKPTTQQHIPQPGDEVPDFTFVNQSGRRDSFKRYRGKVLLVTFIYTRCPFPDFCPRMSSNFAQIYQQIGANPNLLAKTHLLSLSFDPGHDTAKVLRDYAFSVAHTREAALFSRWEFGAPQAADLPRIADFFGVVYQPEGGLITHNLSTTVIGPDGKILKWYHGGDWQVSDLIKDAAEALGRKG